MKVKDDDAIPVVVVGSKIDLAGYREGAVQHDTD